MINIPTPPYFIVLEIPVCSNKQELRDLERDARYLSREGLCDAYTHMPSGLAARVDPSDLSKAKKFLREFADSIANQLNQRFNEEAKRKPAGVTQIHWPEGAELLEMQDGTAMVRGAQVLLGARHVAYLGSEVASIRLSEGFSMKQQADGSYQVVSVDPELLTEGRRILRFSKQHWSKDGAWKQLKRQFKVTRENNPWRAHHNSSYWQWYAPLEDGDENGD